MPTSRRTCPFADSSRPGKPSTGLTCKSTSLAPGPVRSRMRTLPARSESSSSRRDHVRRGEAAAGADPMARQPSTPAPGSTATRRASEGLTPAGSSVKVSLNPPTPQARSRTGLRAAHSDPMGRTSMRSRRASATAPPSWRIPRDRGHRRPGRCAGRRGRSRAGPAVGGLSTSRKARRRERYGGEAGMRPGRSLASRARVLRGLRG